MVSNLFTQQVHNRLNKLQSYSLPSAQYVNLTLGASDTDYIAPADGYVVFQKTSSSSTQCQFGVLAKVTNGTETITTANIAVPKDYTCHLFLPVSKGDTFRVRYVLGRATRLFAFIYAVGSEPA